eukprot:762804-Hanusia_phi.AAC.2
MSHAIEFDQWPSEVQLSDQKVAINISCCIAFSLIVVNPPGLAGDGFERRDRKVQQENRIVEEHLSRWAACRHPSHHCDLLRFTRDGERERDFAILTSFSTDIGPGEQRGSFGCSCGFGGREKSVADDQAWRRVVSTHGIPPPPPPPPPHCLPAFCPSC